MWCARVVSGSSVPAILRTLRVPVVDRGVVPVRVCMHVPRMETYGNTIAISSLVGGLPTLSHWSLPLGCLRR